MYCVKFFYLALHAETYLFPDFFPFLELLNSNTADAVWVECLGNKYFVLIQIPFIPIGKRSIVQEEEHPRTARSIMDVADTNGDGLLDAVEAAEFLGNVGKIQVHEVDRVKRSAETPLGFAAMDTNSNGFIEPIEIDGDYKWLVNWSKKTAKSRLIHTKIYLYIFLHNCNQT